MFNHHHKKKQYIHYSQNTPIDLFLSSMISLPLNRDKSHFFQIIAFQLFQEMRTQLESIIQHSMQPLLKRYFLHSNKVPQRHHRANLHRRRVYKHLASIFNRISDKPIGQPEILLGILFIVIVQIDVQVLKILVSFGVLFGSHVEDMRNPEL